MEEMQERRKKRRSVKVRRFKEENERIKKERRPEISKKGRKKIM